MVWRSSQFFERQIEAISKLGDEPQEAPFLAEARNACDDEPLMIYADWLEERGDSRAQYIRDMCNLALGKERPIGPLFDRVVAFERSLDPIASCFRHTIGTCSVVTVNKREQFDDAPETAELLDPAAREASMKLVVNLSDVPFIGSDVISILLRTHQAIRKSGGQFNVIIAKAFVRHIFRLVRLVPSVFRFAANVDEAIHLATAESALWPAEP